MWCPKMAFPRSTELTMSSRMSVKMCPNGSSPLILSKLLAVRSLSPAGRMEKEGKSGSRV